MTKIKYNNIVANISPFSFYKNIHIFWTWKYLQECFFFCRQVVLWFMLISRSTNIPQKATRTALQRTDGWCKTFSTWFRGTRVWLGGTWICNFFILLLKENGEPCQPYTFVWPVLMDNVLFDNSICIGVEADSHFEGIMK